MDGKYGKGCKHDVYFILCTNSHGHNTLLVLCSVHLVFGTSIMFYACFYVLLFGIVCDCFID